MAAADETTATVANGNGLAEDQVLVAGVIDTLTNFVEHPDLPFDERIIHALADAATSFTDNLLGGLEPRRDTIARGVENAIQHADAHPLRCRE